MVRVSKKTSCMVKPAEQTWSGKLALSELDQTGLTVHVPTMYFYTKSPEDWLNALQTLKTSLSTTLVHFYPLAGRLSAVAGGRLELDCNAAGVQFVEAYADIKLTDLETFFPSPIYHQLTPPPIDYVNATLKETPVLLLQVTRFVCGGFSLGISVSHVVVDGESALHFVSEWARVSRGELIESPPYLDKKVLRAGDPPRAISSSVEHPEFDPPRILITENESERDEKETEVTMLQLTATQVEKLRNKANNSRKIRETDRGFTRYEAISAHIWRTACKVRKHKPEQPTALAISVDIRGKMIPPLPRKYFGNGIVEVTATGRSGEMVSNPLGYGSSKIREAIEKVDDAHVNSVIDFLKGQEDLSKFREKQASSNDDDGHSYGNPNLGVVSWLTLPLYGVDFGWGKEVHMGPGIHDFDGASSILPGKDGDRAVVVALCLQARYMNDFKKVFYQDIEME